MGHIQSYKWHSLSYWSLQQITDIDNSDIENSEVDNSDIDNSEVENSNVDNGDIENSNVDNSDIDNSEVDNSEVDNSDVRVGIWYDAFQRISVTINSPFKMYDFILVKSIFLIMVTIIQKITINIDHKQTPFIIFEFYCE